MSQEIINQDNNRAMAEFKGKSAEREVFSEAKEGLVNLRVRVQVDQRDPEEWGTHPVSLFFTGGTYDHTISSGSFVSLSEVQKVAVSLGGALGKAIRSVVEEIDPTLKGYLRAGL